MSSIDKSCIVNSVVVNECSKQENWPPLSEGEDRNKERYMLLHQGKACLRMRTGSPGQSKQSVSLIDQQVSQKNKSKQVSPFYFLLSLLLVSLGSWIAREDHLKICFLSMLSRTTNTGVE